MARTNFVKNFDLPFPIVIRGHHIYKTIWTAVVGQELIAKPDEREEVLVYDKFSVGVFKSKEEENKWTQVMIWLKSHVPIKIASLLYYILKADK